ncbi:TPR and ankyrin repeat-containing protein 1-like isoform X2 [Lineus longissimus]|uniref:TPR and ankyrin repeat-containing protein 1-like isoform X2 n=1 Tax=Lineus longissimus TaxID=88925 RepID=UPI00315C7315
MGDFVRWMQALQQNSGDIQQRRQEIAMLRASGNHLLEKGDVDNAARTFGHALDLAQSTGDNDLWLQTCNDRDHCYLVQQRNLGRKKLETGDIKGADEVFTNTLAIADVAEMQRGLHLPKLREELYCELDHCQALLLKEDGKKAIQDKDFSRAIEIYTNALVKARAAQRDDLHLQLLINRSIASSKLGNHNQALDDAQQCIDAAPHSCYKGYFRKGQVLKTLKESREALDAMREGLAATNPPLIDKVNFVMEILMLTSQLLQTGIALSSADSYTGPYEHVLAKCNLDGETWSQVFKKLAAQHKWVQMKQLVLDEDLDMYGCGSHVQVVDLIEYCNKNEESRDAKLWGQKLAIKLMERGSLYPKKASSTFMKRALDLGIITGDFCLLKFIFKEHVKSVAERNQVDEAGESLYHYLTRSYDTGQGNALIALKLFGNHEIDVCTQNNGKTHVECCTKPPQEQKTMQEELGSEELKTRDTQSPDTRPVSKLLKNKEPTSQATLPLATSFKPPIPDSSGQGGARPKEKSYQCLKCRQNDGKAKWRFKSYKTDKACKLWVGNLSEDGHPQKDHKQWRSKAQSGISRILKQNREVPECLTKLNGGEYSYFVKEAGHSHDWKLAKELITTYEKHNGEDSIKELAKDVDITGYFDRREHERDDTTLEMILRAGASAAVGPTYKRLPLKEAITYEDWKAIPLLVEYGADAGDFSLTEGDTPLHAALQVAMTEDKQDNFNVLERLIDLHQSDPTRYPDLDSLRQDILGDTLFHVAAKAKDPEVGMRAAEFLFDKGVNPNILNNDGKTALECLPKKNDRRAQVIKVACEEFFQYAEDEKTVATTKKNRAKDFNRQVSTDSSKAIPSPDASSSTVTGVKPRLGKEKGRAARLIREDIQKFLDNIEVESGYSDDLNEEEEEDENRTNVTDQDASSGQAFGVNPKGDTTNRNIQEAKEVTLSSTSSATEVEGQGAYRSNVNSTISIKNADEKGTVDLEVMSAVGNILQQEVTDKHGNSGMEPDLGTTTDGKGEGAKTSEDSDHDSLDGNDEDDTIDPISFKGLEWEIECTAEVWNALYKKNFDNKMKNRIFKTIKMLASGEFDNQYHLKKRLHSVPPELQLYEAKITKAARLIWEIDIAFSSRQSDPSTIRLTENQREVQSTSGKPIYAEIIRLWDIVFNHDHIHRSVQNVVKSHSKGEESLFQKKLEGIKGKDDSYSKGGKRIPMTFTEVDGGLQPVKRFFPPASAKETEYHIMKWYSFDYLVSSILQNQSEKIDFPFSVTEREYAVINIDQKPPCALLLLGRSGTGKTTCCLYRLWSRFVAYWKLAKADNPLIPRAIMHIHSENDNQTDGGEKGDEECSNLQNSTKSSPEPMDVSEDEDTCDHLHQVFITKNPVLCTEISKNFKYLSHGCREAKPHVDVEDEPLPNRLQLAHECAYPLFVTSKQFLVLLDASLPEPHYFPRNEDGSVKREIAGWGEEDGPLTFIPDMDVDDDILPVDEDDKQTEQVAGHDHDRDQRREVTYEVFAEELWPEIIKTHKRVTCHPTLVWTEINSFIKGSIEALSNEDGHLNLEEYNQLGKKRAPNFPGCREQVFQLFETYSVLIKRRRWFDEMDLIFDLHKRMKNVPVPEWYIHEIYVDETQDFTQAELALLIRCCHDPNYMFLTGDTAQSIMRGIAFRFEDLKSLFYYAKETSQRATGNRKLIEVPKTVYQLIHNYRSHAGILDLATSLLDLIDCFFPASYDKKGLEKDRGIFKGPPPVLINCRNYSDLAMVLCGNKRETSQIEFGAHQAILVVNDEARDNLPEELGFGLVLTIYESKGLEFDDILIYNFFKDSQATEEWRVVLKYLDKINQQEQESPERMTKDLVEIDIDASTDKCRPRSLDFNPEKHKILNSELKHLYTAVTRARVNIWFFDEDEEARAPMFTYFQARKLVKTVEAKGEEDEQKLTELFSKKSSKQEWKLKGDDLLRKNLFRVAAECYKKAGRTRLYQRCLANQQALEAKRTDDKHLKRERYLAVSLEYLRCHEYLQAAKCLFNAREHKMAATLFGHSKVKKYMDAAILYKLLGSKDKACEMYELGKAYKEAIHLYYEMQKYDKAIDVLRRYQKTVGEYQRRNEPIPRRIVEHQPCQTEDACHMCNLRNLGQKAAQKHLQAGNLARMVQCLEFVRHDDAIRLLTKNGLREMAADFHRKHGKNIEAAKLYKHLGNIDRAIECVETDTGESSDQILCGELKLEKARSLLQHKAPEEATTLLKSAEMVFANHKDPMKEAECLLLRGIHSNIDNKSRERFLFNAYRKYGSKDTNSPMGEIECIYEVVKLFPKHITMRECGNMIIRCIGIALQLVTWLKHPTGGPTVKAVEAVKTCLRFYGVETFGLQDKSLLEISHPQARILNLFDSALLDDGKILKVEAKNLIVKDILQEKLKVMWSHARAIAKRAKTVAIMCPQYRLGFACAKLTDGSDCSLRHKPYDRQSFGVLIESSTLLMQLDTLIAKTKKDPTLHHSEVEMLEKHYTDCNVIDSFNDLCEIIFPLDRQESVLFGSFKVTNAFLEGFRKTAVKDQILWNATSKMERFITNDKAAKYRVSNLHFFLHTTYLLVGDTRKIQQLLLETEKDENPPVAIYTAFEVLQVNQKTTVRHHIFRYIVNMLSILYEDNNPMDTIGHCDKYFHKVASRGHTKMFPSFAHTMMMFEYQLSLSCCMYLKNIGRIDHSFLPKSYLAHIAFFDCAYGGENQLLTFSIIQNYRAQDRYIARLKGGLWSFAKLFCGQRFPGFHMIRDAFAKGSPWIKTGEAERVFVFALVLLVNINKAIPNKWKQSRKSLELMLMSDIATIDLYDTSCPQRLRDAVEATKRAKGLRYIVRILIKLLVARGEDELMDCTWAQSRHKRRNFCSDQFTNYSLILDNFYQFSPNSTASGGEKESAQAAEPQPEEREEEAEDEDEEAEEERTGDSDYAKKVLLQQEAHQLDIEQGMSSTEVTTQSEEATDVDLKIDDTMCNTCGVTFSSETTDEQSGLVESEVAIEGISPREKLAKVGVERQISNDSGPSSFDFSRSLSNAPAQTRQEHESSEAHINKQIECRTFLKFLQECVAPLQEEVISSSLPEDESLKEHLARLNEKLVVLIDTQREKRDWSNMEPLRTLCESFKEAIEELRESQAAQEQEPEQKPSGEPMVNASAGPEGEGFHAQLNAEEVAKIPDVAVVGEPPISNRKKEDYRRKPDHKRKPLRT